MYHGVYLRNRPKSKWLLFSVSTSPEKTSLNVERALEQAKKEGYENPEVAVKIYEISDHIPEMLNEVVNQKLLYN